MSDAKPTHIEVGCQGNLVVIKLTSHCTLTIGTGLRHLLDQCRRPRVTDVYFDLSQTEYIDSTCVGLLVSLALKRSDPAVPRIHLLKPSSGVVRTLEAMYVLDHLDRCDTPPVTITTWTELPLEETDRQKIAAIILDAHENLIRADARNTEEFGPVVEGLRAHQQPDKANPDL